MKIQRGARGILSQQFDTGSIITVRMTVAGGAVYDCTCFGIDSAGQLSDDRYMVFYNQTASPEGAVKYVQSSDGAAFSVSLNALPQRIQKLVFTVSIDGGGTMGQIQSHSISVMQDGREPVSMTLSGADFHAEKAIISMELYRKGEWRYAAVASGFNGGLGDLLRFFGGEEAAESAPAPVSAPQPARISLEKKLSAGAPKLISLAKPIMREIERNNLMGETAQVALVLDISGSMRGRYSNGTVQEIVNKTLPLAVQFDDNGALDFWYYGTTCRKMPDVTMKNYQDAVPEDWRGLMKQLGGSNNECAVLREIIDMFSGSRVPVYVLFITDGGVNGAPKIKKLLTEASHYPVFFQFVGVGGRNYGILQNLDTMDGRYVDNANFFALDDFRTVPNEELYRRLLAEFPDWLREIRRKGMIP